MHGRRGKNWVALLAVLMLAGCGQDHKVAGPVPVESPKPSAQGTEETKTTKEVKDEPVKFPWLVEADIKKVVAGNISPDKAAELLQSVVTGMAAANVKVKVRAQAFDPAARAVIEKYLDSKGPAQIPAALVALWWSNPKARELAKSGASDKTLDEEQRTRLLAALAALPDPANRGLFTDVAADSSAPYDMRSSALDALGSLDDPVAAKTLIEQYPNLDPDLQTVCMNSLVKSNAAAMALLAAVEAKTIPQSAVGSNQVRQLVELNNPELVKKVSAFFGSVKTERDPARVEVIKKMRDVLQQHKGVAKNGQKVFQKTCMVCHAIYGKGNDVGPNLTGTGRENIDAILANVLDPNLVIGTPYLVHLVRTKDKKMFTGLLVEDSEQRIILKKEGSVLETIPRADVDKVIVQQLSLMPEGLEKTMSEQDFCDLVAFLLTTEPPEPW